MKQDLGQKDTNSWIIWMPQYSKCDLKDIKASLQPSGQRLITYFALEFTSANDRSQKVPPTERTRMQSRRECLKNPFGHARRIARGGLLTVTLALWDLYITQEWGLESFPGYGYQMYVLSGEHKPIKPSNLIWWWDSTQ